MPDALWAGILAGYAIAIPVGPIAILIFDIGLRRGLRVAAAAGAGAASADGFYATLAGLVGAAIAGAIAPLIGPARILGALLLGVIAVRGLRQAAGARPEDSWVRAPTGESAPRPYPVGRRAEPVRTYVLFLGLTIVNPLTFLYFGALMLGLPAVAAGGDRLFFALGAFGASLSWQLLLASAGALLHGRLPARLKAATRAIGSVIILGFAARLLLST